MLGAIRKVRDIFAKAVAGLGTKGQVGVWLFGRQGGILSRKHNLHKVEGMNIHKLGRAKE